jgi:iron(III) transport system ATP-binding protein
MNVLDVNELTKSFGRGKKAAPDVAAVKSASFNVAGGEFFTLLGPSGCGKTTMLRCIAGLERPDSGQIAIDGTLVFSLAPGMSSTDVRTERRPIGMVFQSYAIWPHMNVYDNVAFPLVSGREHLSRKLARQRVLEVLERVSLADKAEDWSTKLSGGQQQRLALARALVCRPKVLLLDEPLSNLDASLRVALRKELKEFQRAFGVTTLYVTHDQNEALALSDKIAVVRNGVIVQQGTPREIYDHPANKFVARLVGAANVLSGPLISGGSAPAVETTFGVIECGGTTDLRVGSPVSCFIRRENVLIQSASVPEAKRAGRVPDEIDSQSQPTGVLTAVDYVGSGLECTVRRGDTELQGWARASTQLRPGDEVTVRIARADATLLPDETPEPSPDLGVLARR